ncbi:uncharacterized protein LOC123290668 [Chrysoperla carnea]|uniref:uncharacterized protein LOC123290668 n=1 Tax=Chrysoperla carnea TaxID=189513 RepID=UPI001D05C9B9|nr:uncharacterized protein LOC123290668 [Chrysoperla carnea]
MAYADSNLCKKSEFSGRTLGVELDLPSNQQAQSTVGAETLVKSKNDRLKTNKITTTNHQESESSGELLELDSSTKSTFNDHKQSRTATNSSRSSYEEKHNKQRNIMKHHPQLAVKVNPTVAIQTETCNENVQKNNVDCFSKEIQENKSQVEENLVCSNSKKHKQRPPHLIGDNTNMIIQHCNENLKKNCIDCYSKEILENKGQVEENFVCSNSKKHKQRPPHVIGDNTNMIVQHCRNSSTQTSYQKITDNNSNASSSSEQYPCKCCKSVKVNQATQTYCKSSSSSKNKYSNEEAKNTTKHKHKTKNQLTSLTLNTNSSSYNSSPSSGHAPAPVPQQPTNLNYKHCTCSQQGVHSKNSINQPTSPSLYLPLKSSTTESQQNSSRQFSKTSSFASPEIVPESGTNSIEFIKNTHKPPSVPVAQKFISNYKSRESSSNSKERQYAHDTNLINYKTWPSHLESMKKVLDMDKFVPSSDRIVQQNTNNLKFTRKPSRRTSKDSEYEHNVEKYSSDSTDKSIDIMDKYLTMTKKCSCKQVEDPLPVPSPSQLDVRNDPSCYSTSNYNTQLPDTRSQNSRGLCEDLSKESHGFKDSPAASSSHHIYSNHSSIHYYSRRTSSEIITAEDVAEQNITTKHDDDDDDEGEYEEEQLHLRSSTSAECMYDHSKCNCIGTASSQLHLHKRIQQMLNRCTTCSEQQQQQQTSSCYNKPQIKYCSDCYCQCLLYFNSNQQQQSLLCNSCKLKQQQQQQFGGGTRRRNHNSIAYFLRIESRDDLILEEEATNCNQQNKSTTIEQVKIYIPKLIKNNSGHLISNKNQNHHHNHVKYVEEIGFNHNEKSFQSLQEYLSKNKPEFIDAAADRQQYLKEISEKRHKHTNTNSNMNTRKNHTAETNYKSKKTKIFSSRKMKEITYRKYRTLPEVQQKMYNMKLFRQRRANRLMMELFNKKLQQKVHKGELDLSLTKTLL